MLLPVYITHDLNKDNPGKFLFIYKQEGSAYPVNPFGFHLVSCAPQMSRNLVQTGVSAIFFTSEYGQERMKQPSPTILGLFVSPMGLLEGFGGHVWLLYGGKSIFEP